MKNKKNIFSSIWAKITGVTITIITLFGGGYAAGIYQETIQCNLDKNIMVTEYQSRLREELNRQKECETVNYNTNDAALLRLINIIKSDEKK